MLKYTHIVNWLTRYDNEYILFNFYFFMYRVPGAEPTHVAMVDSLHRPLHSPVVFCRCNKIAQVYYSNLKGL